LDGSASRLRVSRKLGRLCRTAECLCVRLGIKLDTIGADPRSRTHRLRLGIHEKADANAERFHFRDERLHAQRVAIEVPSVIGGHSARIVRDHRELMGAHGAHELERVLERIAFDVQLGVRVVPEERREVAHVVRPDVALVGARMHRNSVCARVERDFREANDTRNTQRALVAQEGDFIHVYREPRHVDRAAREPAGWSSCSSRSSCRVCRTWSPR
jgi:hypothetical protein